MKRKHEKILALVKLHPPSGNVKWRDVVSLIEALGGELEEREGSRVAIILDGHVLLQHKPHPSPDMDKGAVAAVREFLVGLDY